MQTKRTLGVWAKPGNKAEQRVYNIKCPPGSENFELTPTKPASYKGYFSFYLNNTVGTVPSVKNDVLITAVADRPDFNLTFKMNTTSWPHKNSSMWQGAALRLKTSDPQYRPNSQYYIVVKGNSAGEDEKSDRDTPSITFLVIEEKRAVTLQVGRRRKAGQHMLFRCPLKEDGDYVVIKRGITGEDMYISISPNNHIPFADEHDYNVEANITDATSSKMQEYMKVITREDLRAKNPACVVSEPHPDSCALYIFVMCHESKCIYELTVSHIARKGAASNVVPKADL